MAERMIPTSIAARRLGVCVETVKRWLQSGTLRGSKTVGGHWRIPESEILLRLQIVDTNRNTPIYRGSPDSGTLTQ